MLHRNRAHVPIVCIESIGMMQPNINAEADPVILRVYPASIDDLICIGGSIDRTIGDAVIYAVMTVVPDPIAKAI